MALIDSLASMAQQLSSSVAKQTPIVTQYVVKDMGAIVIAIIAAIGACAAAIVPPLVKRRQELQDRSIAKIEQEEQARRDIHSAGLSGVVELYDLLNHILRIGGDRVILFVGKDSGGVPAPGSPYYASSIHGVVRHEYENLINRYHNIHVDEAYIRMIMESLKSPLATVKNTTATMPDCMLSRFYKAEGVVESIVIGLGVLKNQFYYLSIATHGSVFGDDQITKCQLVANDIWQLINADSINNK